MCITIQHWWQMVRLAHIVKVCLTRYEWHCSKCVCHWILIRVVKIVISDGRGSVHPVVGVLVDHILDLILNYPLLLLKILLLYQKLLKLLVSKGLGLSH